MPSTILGQPHASGPQAIVSGNPYSGQLVPVGGIQLRWHPQASGYCYVGLSGNMTLNSGGAFLSGGGVSDGMVLSPGDPYFIPKIAFRTSGQFNVYAYCDQAASGQGRLYWEIY